MPKLGVEVRQIVGDIGLREGDLVIERHLLHGDIRHRHAKPAPVGHFPVTVERTAGVHTQRAN